MPHPLVVEESIDSASLGDLSFHIAQGLNTDLILLRLEQLRPLLVRCFFLIGIEKTIVCFGFCFFKHRISMKSCNYFDNCLSNEKLLHRCGECFANHHFSLVTSSPLFLWLPFLYFLTMAICGPLKVMNERQSCKPTTYYKLVLKNAAGADPLSSVEGGQHTIL